MTFQSVGLIAIGIALLVAGAEIFVRGASRIAILAGISPLVVGLTIVAFGTSAPEVAVSVQAALSGSSDLALGNVVGSNICNVLLILGISALIAPLVVNQQLVRLDVPLMIAVSVAVLVMGLDGGISRIDGILLIAGAVAYTSFLIVQSRRETSEIVQQYDSEFGPDEDVNEPGWGSNVLLILAGLLLLLFGSRWLVSGAVAIASALGVNQLIVGLTVVALGTSLPEVATSVVAALRGERDIAVGNVVGSNLFNLLLVLGLTAVVAPAGIPVHSSTLRFDLPVMIAAAAACLPIFFTGNRIDRWEGVLFLGYYIAYNAYLVLSATDHQALPVYSGIMKAFVLPITVATLLAVAWNAWRNGNGRAGEGALGR